MDPHSGPIRWGIAATGHIAGRFATSFAHVDDPDASLAAVGSRHQETADRFANEHGIATAHGSYAALAADPNVDVVYVASLQPGHVADAVRFLEAGKHVLVEKPMALSAGGVDTITAAARANDRFAMEAMWMRFNPAPVAAVEMIERGDIGRVTRIDADFVIPVPNDPTHRLRSLEKGGGALLDLGIYPVTLAWWLLGPPTDWTVEGTTEAGVDTHVVIEATWDGASARLTCGLDGTDPIAARIEGTDGTVELSTPFFGADAVTVDGATSRFEAASLHHQVPEVNRCLRAGLTESPRNPWGTTRAILAWCDDVLGRLGVVYPDGC
ncbi:MAG: Gfo/Idh/MocA family oxidoreductase [Actinomycetota bacterium]